MAEACLSTPGVAEVFYSWLSDKKAFSETSKSARSWFMQFYFPRGLYPRRMTVRPHDAGNRACASVACRRTLPKNAGGGVMVMGMLNPSTIGMLRFCHRPQCREAAIKTSYSRMARSLMLDAGRGYYLDPKDFKSYFHRAVDIARTRLLPAGPAGLWTVSREGAKATLYSRVRSLHDSVVTAMFKRAMAADAVERPEEKIAWQAHPVDSMVFDAIASSDEDWLVKPDKKTFDEIDAVKSAVFVSF